MRNRITAIFSGLAVMALLLALAPDPASARGGFGGFRGGGFGGFSGVRAGSFAGARAMAPIGGIRTAAIGRPGWGAAGAIAGRPGWGRPGWGGGWRGGWGGGWGMGLASCCWRCGRRRPRYSLGLGRWQLYVLERLDLGGRLRWLGTLRFLRLRLVIIGFKTDVCRSIPGRNCPSSGMKMASAQGNAEAMTFRGRLQGAPEKQSRQCQRSDFCRPSRGQRKYQTGDPRLRTRRRDCHGNAPDRRCDEYGGTGASQ